MDQTDFDRLGPDIDRLGSVFFPFDRAARARVRSAGNHFVYYTTAAVAASILANQEIWMRNARVMNDYREIEHGFRCLGAANRTGELKAFWKILKECNANAERRAAEAFRNDGQAILNDSFLFCMSEHDTDEDHTGRLSMWRAYGAQTGVALVLNGAPFHSSSTALNMTTSPVLYGKEADFARELGKVVARMEEERKFLSAVHPGFLAGTAFQVLRHGVLCTKHPGFGEEREWRVMSTPTRQHSPHVRVDVEIVRGTPQRVVKIPLRDVPEKGLRGVELPQFLERVIIGPCEFPSTVADGLYELMRRAKIEDAESRIVIADLPLRHLA